MERRGLNSAKLAEMTGLTRSSLSYFLHGKRQPSRPVLSEFADKLSVTVDYLLGSADGPDIAELLKNPRIMKLVGLYKDLTANDQEQVLAMIEQLKQATPQQTEAASKST